MAQKPTLSLPEGALGREKTEQPRAIVLGALYYRGICSVFPREENLEFLIVSGRLATKPPIRLLLVSLALACIGQFDALGSELQSASMPAPVQVSPADQARLHAVPRTVVFEWTKVPGANWYGIEIDYYDSKAGQWSSQAGKPTFVKRIKEPKFTFDFYGDQPGSWRVWAIDKKERPGEISPWSLFTFGQDNQPMPQPPPATAPRSRPSPAEQVTRPQGKFHEPPVFDPKTGEACAWPLLTGKPNGVIGPTAIYTPEPDFPAAAAAHANGDVMLAVDIGEDGVVKRVCLLSTSREEMGRQAIDAVRTWRFKPAQKDGAPIPYSTTVEVNFWTGR